jgi:hypothetical protein
VLRNDEASVHAHEAQTDLVREVIAEEPAAGQFAETGMPRRSSATGHRCGRERSVQGCDGYWDIATESTALHVAAWRAQHRQKLLIERASITVMDGKGRTPLALAFRACVDSGRTGASASVEALLGRVRW